MFSEGNAAHPVGCDSPLQIEMSVWHATNLKKSAQNRHYYLQLAVTPYQISQEFLFAEGRRALKAVQTL